MSFVLFLLMIMAATSSAVFFLGYLMSKCIETELGRPVIRFAGFNLLGFLASTTGLLAVISGLLFALIPS